MNILLSVIVPVYNIELYLEQCIDSIVNQTYSNLEIILVDDGSTDNSGNICDDYAKKDSRIVVVHKKNGGLVSARKAAANIATGDYIINVDGDDWIDSNRFENLVKMALVDMPDMVYLCGVYREYKNKTIFSHVPNDIYGEVSTSAIWNESEKYLIRTGNFVDRVMEFAQWSWCVKRNIYLNNQMSLSDKIIMMEDVAVIVPALLESKTIFILEEPSYHYRQQREGSINERKKNYALDCAKIFYDEMDKSLRRVGKRNNPTICCVIAKLIYNSAMLTNYKDLFEYYNLYLFPYPIVANGSSVIVYGAGNLGVEIVNAILSSNRFNLVGWVDKNRKENPRTEGKIDLPEKILKLEYDFIVVAVINANIAREIKKELTDKGVLENKIVLMSSKDMTMKNLDDIYGTSF